MSGRITRQAARQDTQLGCIADATLANTLRVDTPDTPAAPAICEGDAATNFNIHVNTYTHAPAVVYDEPAGHACGVCCLEPLQGLLKASVTLTVVICLQDCMRTASICLPSQCRITATQPTSIAMKQHNRRHTCQPSSMMSQRGTRVGSAALNPCRPC
jgi:hypothetical protein